jgi:hypothetical protein
MENNCYIYVHYRGDNLSPFYVGKGTRKDKNTYKGVYERAFRKSRNNKYWNRIVNKVGYHVLIIHDNLTEPQAFDMERAYINWYGRENLVNFTDGGEGMSGYKHTEEAKKKYKNSMEKYYNSEEHKKKLSDAGKGQISWNKGKKLSEEHKRKMSNSLKGRESWNKGKSHMSLSNHPRAKKVINTETGEIYGCAMEVCILLNIKKNTFSRYLSGERKNPTPFRYYEETPN